MKSTMKICAALAIVSIVSCSGAEEKVHEPASPPAPPSAVTAPEAETPPIVQTGPDRDAWQRPDVIIGMADPDLRGMVFADLFAGDGYFTFKLIEAGANVIAVDNDPANIAILERRKKELGLGDDRLRIRAVPVGDPGLAPGEADVALLVHHYAGIKDKPAYFAQMRKGLRYPRPLLLVDWQYRETAIGPPMSERIPVDKLMQQIADLGYSDVGAHSDKIPFQVIYFATDPMDI
ncbi:MAG: class I SAM-dependent methyltransferase [Flavobacteriales bacterium]